MVRNDKTTAAAIASGQTDETSNTSNPGPPSWCIFVKTVGKGFESNRKADDETSKVVGDGTFSFSVKVSPEDKVDCLHEEIEGVTGVKASQQRLIYRGRLIGKADVSQSVNLNGNTVSDRNESGDNIGSPRELQNSLTNPPEHDEVKAPNEYKIKDIVGLCDGHTIHLVRKRDSAIVEQAEGTMNSSVATSESRSSFHNREDNNSNSDANANANTITDGNRGSVNGGGALLAALLGLGSLAEENSGSNIAPGIGTTGRSPSNETSNRTTEANGTGTTNTTSWRVPATRGGTSTNSGRVSRSIHRPNYRLSAEDLEVLDPGSMESVRQGLMTIHTIVNSQSDINISTHHSSQTILHPLGANREWFRGQWIDARDTVNQWLEATIIDIVDPVDILDDSIEVRIPPIYEGRYANPEEHPPRQRRVPNVDNDPAISANDFEGRRMLLLEECEPGDPLEFTQISQQSFRCRRNNDCIQLLLIHYNGWPHRWDEWIRSDSERIRPFRTRTRHPDTSSLASPTPQCILHEAPSTNIVEDGDQVDERLALLAEMNRSLSQVSNFLGGIVAREQRGRNLDSGRSFDDDSEGELEELHAVSQLTNHLESPTTSLPWMTFERNENVHSLESIPLPSSGQVETSNIDLSRDGGLQGQESDRRTTYSQTELRNIATLFDRLGRTLTDAAPHIASLAGPHREQEDQPEDLTLSSSEAPSSQQQGSDVTIGNSSSIDLNSSSAPLGGLLSIWSRERERRRQGVSVEHSSAPFRPMQRPTEQNASIDPDHLDFASGVVNTTRGEVRSGPRSRTTQQQDDMASLLGTYLAAASLGSVSTSNDDGDNSNPTSGLARLLQRNGSSSSGDSNSNGIDIHIHAIVTAPGVSPGGVGIATLGGGVGSPTTILGGTRNAVGRSARSQSSGTSLSANIVEPTDPEDYSDLFSELYSESPTPIDPNASTLERQTSRSSSTAPPSPSRRSGNSSNSPRNSPINQRLSLSLLTNSNSAILDENRSSPPNTQPTVSQPTSDETRSSPRHQSSERRSPSVFRLFRRRGGSHRDRS